MAVLLALIGVHGVLAYSVARRTREIGVRLAIGADPAAVARPVMREGSRLTLLGVAIGLPAAPRRPIAAQSDDSGSPKPIALTFAVGCDSSSCCSACAGIAPARRAASVDPVIALRAE